MKRIKAKSVQLKKWRYAMLIQAILATVIMMVGSVLVWAVLSLMLHLDIEKYEWIIEIGVLGLWGIAFFLLDRIVSNKDSTFSYDLIADFYEEHVEITDRRKHYMIRYADIKDLSYWDILYGEGRVNPIAFKVYIKTPRRRYRLNSQLVSQEEYVKFNTTELATIYNELYIKSNLRF